MNEWPMFSYRLFVHLISAKASLFLNFLNFQIVRMKLVQPTSQVVVRMESQGNRVCRNILKL